MIAASNCLRRLLVSLVTGASLLMHLGPAHAHFNGRTHKHQDEAWSLGSLEVVGVCILIAVLLALVCRLHFGGLSSARRK